MCANHRTTAALTTIPASFHGCFWVAYAAVSVAITTIVPYTVLATPPSTPKNTCLAARATAGSGSGASVMTRLDRR